MRPVKPPMFRQICGGKALGFVHAAGGECVVGWEETDPRGAVAPEDARLVFTVYMCLLFFSRSGF